MQPEVRVEEVSPVKRKLTIDVPLATVVEVLEEAYLKVGKTAKLKGFRQGKVPRHLVEQYYRHEAEAQAMEALVQKTWPAAVTQAALAPLARPDIVPGALARGQPFQYVATVEVRPQVTIGTYKGFKLEREEAQVADPDLDTQLEQIRLSMTKLEPVPDGTALDRGMVARVDFRGTMQGKPFEGGEASDFVMDVGSGNLLPAFEEAVIGMQVGETRNITVSYPDDYFNVQLAGEAAAFAVTLRDIKCKNVPGFTDDLARDVGPYQTLQELREAIRAHLAADQEQKARAVLGEQAIKQLLDSHHFEIPDTMVGWELHSMYQQIEQRAKSEGKTLQDVRVTPEGFVKEYETVARDRVRTMLILDAIAQAEQLNVAEADVDARLQQIAQNVGEAVPKVRQYYEKNQLIPSLQEEILREKTLDFIIKESKIKVNKAKKGEK